MTYFLFSFLELLEIRLGEHIRSSTSESSITRDFKVSSITNHPQYAGSSNDIALVKIQNIRQAFVHNKRKPGEVDGDSGSLNLHPGVPSSTSRLHGAGDHRDWVGGHLDQ